MLLLEHGGDPNLANEKEQTSLDVCPSEEIRHILTNTTTKTRPSTGNKDQATEIPLPAAVSDQQSAPVRMDMLESELKEKQESTEEEEKESEEDSAFLSEPLTTPFQSSAYCDTTSTQSATSTATAEDTTQQLPEVTPSRSRRRSKRERGFILKGRGLSDVSSSESDSELMVTARKVPRLMDRVPAILREESASVEERQTIVETGRGQGRDEVGGEGEGELRKASISGDVEAEEKEEAKKLDDDSTGMSQVVAGEWPDGAQEVRKEEEEEEEEMGVKEEGHAVCDVTEVAGVEDQAEDEMQVATGPEIENNSVGPSKEMGELESKGIHVLTCTCSINSLCA